MSDNILEPITESAVNSQDVLKEECLQLITLDSFEIERYVRLCNTTKLDSIQRACLDLHMEIIEQGAKRNEMLVQLSKRAAGELKTAHKNESRASAKIKKVANQSFFKRLYGAVTGSSRSEVNVAIKDCVKGRQSKLSAIKELLENTKKEQRISVRVTELHSAIVCLQAIVQNELIRERGFFYKIQKKIILAISGSSQRIALENSNSVPVLQLFKDAS